MSRTDKDHPKFRQAHWYNIYTPSWHRRMQRKSAREGAAQDMRNGREPQPDYPKRHEYFW